MIFMEILQMDYYIVPELHMSRNPNHTLYHLFFFSVTFSKVYTSNLFRRLGLSVSVLVCLYFPLLNVLNSLFFSIFRVFVL